MTRHSIACCSRSTSSIRLGRPVNPSCSAWCRARCSASVRSVMSSIVSPTPWSGSGKACTAYAVSRVTHVVERHLHARPHDLGERAREVEMGERRERLLRTPAERIAVADAGDRRRGGVRRHESEAPLRLEGRRAERRTRRSACGRGRWPPGAAGCARSGSRGALRAILRRCAFSRRHPIARDDGDEDSERCDDEDDRAHPVSIVATSSPIGDAGPIGEMRWWLASPP